MRDGQDGKMRRGQAGGGYKRKKEGANEGQGADKKEKVIKNKKNRNGRQAGTEEIRV